ncbi:MAG TPA: DUF4389 domain-containing protein [Noviherbaspirillum sp.]
MSQESIITSSERNILIRGLYMLLMAIAWQVSGTVLLVLSVIQFGVALFTGAPLARLARFGRSLAAYTRQVVNFLTFSSEEVPFPFSDWPASE